jgi:hypothetical protein
MFVSTGLNSDVALKSVSRGVNKSLDDGLIRDDSGAVIGADPEHPAIKRAIEEQSAVTQKDGAQITSGQLESLVGGFTQVISEVASVFGSKPAATQTAPPPAPSQRNLIFLLVGAAGVVWLLKRKK